MRRIFILLFLCAFYPVFAQPVLTKYFVQFTDKNNTPYSINNPSAFLSQKAIDRRVNAGIAVDFTDLPVDPAYVNGVASTGAFVIHRLNWFNGVVVYAGDSATLAAINALPYVVQSTPVARMGRRASDLNISLKNDYVFPFESALKTNFNYGPSADQIMLHNGHLLHNQGLTGNGMLIAVIDAGFAQVNTLPAFSRLFQNNLIVAAKDFVNPGGDVYAEHPHGTMVLSLMGGYLDGEIIGTAPDASYLLLRSEDANSELIIEEFNWAAAAQYADSSGADILNTSLGYTTFDHPFMSHTYADLDGNTTPVTIAADMAARKGMLVVNSAGNEGNSAWFHISAAADGDSVMAVGAVDNMGNYVSFSGKGPSYDGRVKPNVAAMGFQTTVASPWGGVFQGNGTSFSGPIIAGLAACLWQAHATKTNMEIFHIIQKSSSQFTTPDSLLGYGIPDFALAEMLLSGVVDNDTDSEKLLGVYPNPFEDHFTLDFYSLKPQKLRINLYDAAGRAIISTENKVFGNSFNRFDLFRNIKVANGMYILKLETESNSYYRKLVKR